MPGAVPVTLTQYEHSKCRSFLGCDTMSAQRLLTQASTIVRHFGSYLSRMLGRASVYRFTDDALLMSAAIAGIVVGLTIVVYHKVLELFEDGLHLLEPSAWYHEGMLASILTGLAFPFIAAIGGLLVGFLKSTVFKGVHHSGLLTVANSVKDASTLLTWRHALHAMVLSSISIASGGGAGREAPTVVLGASVASGLGHLGMMNRRHIRILGAAGAAAAISGIFNAPLGGILFAVEAITGEFRARTFIPVVIASVLATTTVRTILGSKPLLIAPQLTSLSLFDYPLLTVAGIASAFIAAFYLRMYRASYVKTENAVRRLHPILRPALGGFVAGIPLIFLPWLLETTYRPINQAISGSMHDIWWLGLCLAAATIFVKPITNAITLASGGEGGTFAPAMKVGALFGFCLGTLMNLLYPTQVGLYALVCAGAVIAGTFSAPLTGGILLFEISGNYELLLPLMFSSVVAVYIVRRMRVTTFNTISDADSADAAS